MTAKVMRLLDPSTGLMECKIDGARHYANINPDTKKYYRGSWQCDNGCKFDDKKLFIPTSHAGFYICRVCGCSVASLPFLIDDEECPNGCKMEEAP